MRDLRFPSALLLPALLAGCGGGGSGVGSTPPPTSGETYPAQANANVTAPTLNESFTNDAARGSATFNNGALTGIAAAATSLSVRYDASDNGYVLSAGGASYSFARSALQPISGTPFVTASNSATGDAVLLINHANVTLTYVDTGYWLRASLNNLGNGTAAVTAFSFGVETPDGSIPRTGSATYNSGIIGIIATGGLIYDARGGLQLVTNFASGAMTMSGTLARHGEDFNTALGLTILQGNATLSASTNQFAGTLSASAHISGIPLPPVAGTLEGRFYGPTAQETGGAFQMQGSDTLVVGAFSGARVTP
jgi:hypothetical protein